MKTVFHEFFWTTLLSAGVQRTEVRKVNNVCWRKKIHWNLFSSERFDWFCMIHRWGNIRKMIKKHILEKKISGVFFHKKFFLTLLWLGIQISGDRKQNFFLKRACFSKKTILSKRLFENFVIKDQWEQKKDESNWKEKLIIRKKFFGKFLWWESFLMDIVVSESTEDRPWEKEKLYFGESIFFTEFRFSQKILNRWYHSSMYAHTDDDINRKKLFWKVFLGKCFFEKICE